MYLRNIKRVSDRSESFHLTSLLKLGKVRLEEEILPVTKNGSGSAQRNGRSHLTVFKQRGGIFGVFKALPDLLVMT